MEKNVPGELVCPVLVLLLRMIAEGAERLSFLSNTFPRTVIRGACAERVIAARQKINVNIIPVCLTPVKVQFIGRLISTFLRPPVNA